MGGEAHAVVDHVGAPFEQAGALRDGVRAQMLGDEEDARGRGTEEPREARRGVREPDVRDDGTPKDPRREAARLKARRVVAVNDGGIDAAGGSRDARDAGRPARQVAPIEPRDREDFTADAGRAERPSVSPLVPRITCGR
jgi:hypothetical protein